MSEEAADTASDEKRGRSKRQRKKIRPMGKKERKGKPETVDQEDFL
jgi:hypothetical protein